MSNPAGTDQACIRLDDDEAVVLFEFLLEQRRTNGELQATAEGAVLDAMIAQLEKSLVAPFREDYAEILSAARRRLAPD